MAFPSLPSETQTPPPEKIAKRNPRLHVIARSSASSLTPNHLLPPLARAGDLPSALRTIWCDGHVRPDDPPTRLLVS